MSLGVNVDKSLDASQDEMRELIFSIVEETSHIEETLEQIRLDVDMIKNSNADSSINYKFESLENTVNAILEEQNKHKELLASINSNDFNLIKDEVLDNKKIKNLEKKISRIEKMTSAGGVNLKQLSIVKEKSRWQISIICILIFLMCESIYFFGFLFDGTIVGHFMYLSSTLPYLFIMYAMNNRVQKLSIIIQEDKY